MPTDQIIMCCPASESMDDEAYDDLDGDTASLDIEECYEVIKDYVKQAVDELDMFEGQVVCVIDDSDKGEPSRPHLH